MEKEQNQKTEDNTHIENKDNEVINETSNNKSENDLGTKKEETETKPEDKIRELEDKLARTFAEMENQRRRFEKEREEAYEYGGFSFAKEALNLIDNLERSKQILQNDETLKNSDALKKKMTKLSMKHLITNLITI